MFITLGILIPVLFAFNQGKPIDLPKSAKAENALLEVQEFALIISEPLKIDYKGKSKQFGEENDVYVHWVSEPVLCYYEPVKVISKFPIQLLMPRTEPSDCQ